ncbi:MAG: hypothetical protein Q8O84_04480 [Nanoarchaeota archaeon]|nr:hypothetical protein [Nanoarchaeota archaeon]
MTQHFKKIFLIGIFIFLLILNSIFLSASVVYDSYQETAEIISKDEIHEVIEIFINADKFENSINLFLVPGVENLQIYMDNKKLENCEIKEKIGGTEVLCNFEKSFIGKHFLKIEFDSGYPLIKLNQERLMFRSGYEPVAETEEFIFVLKLPLGYIIPEDSDKDKSFFISPEADKIYSDGQRIILKWEEKELNEKFEVSVISEQIANLFNLNFILIIALIVGILFYVLYIKKIKKKKQVTAIKRKKGKSKTEILEGHLMESEKKIIDELKNADKKELWQKQLQLKTDFSKAKLSRIIRNLEARNIIQKIPFGNTNKIKLKIK